MFFLLLLISLLVSPLECQSVDRTRSRTLAVVTKPDRYPDGLLEKVTANDVNIGLGYVCVNNRIREESYEDARKEELKLFGSHTLLSKIDKSIVGIPVLAQKLVQVQAMIISKTLPRIIKKINEKLAYNLSELDNLPANLSSFGDAMAVFMHILSSSTDSLKKILLLRDFREYPTDKHMHCTVRLVNMLDSYAADLRKYAESDVTKDFLMEEITLLEEAKCIGLPNFMPRTAFLTILQRKVNDIGCMPINFVNKVWNYLETVLNHHSANYYQLQVSTRRAGEKLIAKKRKSSIKHVTLVVDMEKLTDYTCNPEYTQEYNKLISRRDYFLQEVLSVHQATHVKIEGVGDIYIVNLRNHPNMLSQAFDLKEMMIAYWKIVLRKLVENIALHFMLSINELVNNDLLNELSNDLLSSSGGGIKRLLEE